MAGIDPGAFRAAGRQLENWRRPLLMTHTKPDGDAVGSLAAMHALLASRGAEPIAWVFDPVPDRYVFLAGSLRRVEGSFGDERGVNADGVFILDTCSYSQLAPAADWLKATSLPKIVVDHHATRDDLGATELIDETAAATCLLLHEWGQVMRWPTSPAIAEALFVGIAMDTGWLRHANTDARALAAIHALVVEGARPYGLYEKLFHQESRGRFRLRAAAMGRLELLDRERLAVTTVPADLFAECGATQADTEDLVNEPLRIGSTVVSVMLVEQADGVIRVGLRSKEPVGAGAPDVDVSAIAAALGGGGHRRAAGVRVQGPLEDARQVVIGLALPALSI